MSIDVSIVTILLMVTFYLLITETIPIDLTGIGIMVALMITGLLPAEEAVSGLANPAVVTVGAMFLVSQAMIRTGAVGFIGKEVLRITRGNSVLAMAVILITVSIASAFINNTPVVVLFIPVIMSMGCRFGISPSKYLIPLSYASILAGTCTLIGTSTNLIVSDLSARYGYGTISMFELSKAGIPIAVVGLFIIFLMSGKMMPDLPNPACELESEQGRQYLAEFHVPRGSKLVGLNPCTDISEYFPGIEVVELIRYSHIYHPCRDEVTIAPDDLLLAKGSPNALVNLMDSKEVRLNLPQTNHDSTVTDKDMVLVELIIPPSSSLIGQKINESRLIQDNALRILAIERHELHYTERQLRDIRLKTGDVMLVWCQADHVARLRGRDDWIIAEDIQDAIIHKRKAPVAGIIFLCMVAGAALGVVDIMVSAVTAVFFMILLGCLPLKDAYRALQANVLLLIAGTIGLGIAMDTTGASQFYAKLLMRIFEGMPPWVILTGFILLTSISTQILSNNATAVLLMPIAISTSLEVGVDPKPFIIGVIFGASACFATPIGYQTNLLVYGPGGYRFSDFLKLGIPLNILVVLGSGLLIPVFWPF